MSYLIWIFIVKINGLIIFKKLREWINNSQIYLLTHRFAFNNETFGTIDSHFTNKSICVKLYQFVIGLQEISFIGND